MLCPAGQAVPCAAGAQCTDRAAAADTLPGMLTTGRADGIGQFTVGEPLLAKSAAPKQVLALAYADVGLDLYGNGVIASDGLIKSNPDLVRRFVTATMQGLADAI